MIAFLTNWKTIVGALVPLAAIGAWFIPGVAAAAGAFLSTKGGRIVAAVAVLAWVGWMYVAYVEATAYQRGANDLRSKIEEQDNRAVEAGRKARIPVTECYAKEGEWSVEEGLCILPK